MATARYHRTPALLTEASVIAPATHLRISFNALITNHIFNDFMVSPPAPNNYPNAYNAGIANARLEIHNTPFGAYGNVDLAKINDWVELVNTLLVRTAIGNPRARIGARYLVGWEYLSITNAQGSKMWGVAAGNQVARLGVGPEVLAVTHWVNQLVWAVLEYMRGDVVTRYNLVCLDAILGQLPADFFGNLDDVPACAAV